VLTATFGIGFNHIGHLGQFASCYLLVDTVIIYLAYNHRYDGKR
jgi:hypothetical protein